MITAVLLSIAVMIAFSGPIARFVNRHPSVKMLALAFLILIGVVLIAEGLHTHVPRGYIYFSMAFSLLVEMLNLRAANRRCWTRETPKRRSEERMTNDRMRMTNVRLRARILDHSSFGFVIPPSPLVLHAEVPAVVDERRGVEPRRQERVDAPAPTPLIAITW